MDSLDNLTTRKENLHFNFGVSVNLLSHVGYFPEIARQKHILDRKHRGRRRNYWNKQPRKLKEKNSGQGEYEPRWEEKESFEERGQKRKFRDEDD